MLKRIVSRVRPSPAMAVALLGVALGLGSTGWAANGGAFILGVVNSATVRTALVANYNGTALQLTNASTGAAATALTLAVAAGHPPMKVNTATKVTNLNADYLDGIDSSSMARVMRIPLTLAAGAYSAPIVLPPNLPVHIMGFRLGGNGNLGEVTIACDLADDLLFWVGAASGSGHDPDQNGSSRTQGDHIVFLDYGQGTIDVQVNGPTSIRVFNGAIVSRSAEITLMW